MALIIYNSEAESLAKELAQLTGETETEALKEALQTRIKLVKKHKQRAIFRQ